MSQIVLVSRKRPRFEISGMGCDRILHKRLEDVPLLALMNKCFAAAICGRPGSGKTSFLSGLLGTEGECFNQVFEEVHVFMPPRSRESMEDNLFKDLPSDRLHDDLTVGDLQKLEGRAENQPKDNNMLVVFDDVQDKMKGACELTLQRMVANRRHIHLSSFFLCQVYNKMPRALRQELSDIFLFQTSKSELEMIFKELLDIEKKYVPMVLKLYLQNRKKNPYEPLYFNTNTRRIFIGWNEVLLDEDIDEKTEEKNSDSVTI